MVKGLVQDPEGVRRLVANGATQTDIARLLGVSQPTVSRFMKQNKIQPANEKGPARGSSRFRAQKIAAVLQARAEGHTAEAIGRMTRVGKSTVELWLREEDSRRG
jgi:predicted transcriptional regulator